MRQKGIRLVPLAQALKLAQRQTGRAQAQEQMLARTNLKLQAGMERAVLQALEPSPRTGAKPLPGTTKPSSKRSRESRTRKPWCNPIPR